MRRQPGGWAVAMGLVALCLGLQLLQARSLAAQHPSPQSLKRIQTVTPRSGPIGMSVRVHTENLPIQAKIYVGVGATHDGWEALAEVQQGELGEVSTVVAIPTFASWERPLVFIVFNGIFSPIAISDPFHVTDGSGRIRREGEVVDRDGCLSLRDRDDYLYALSGAVNGLEPGATVVLEGRYEEAGRCGAGGGLQVEVVHGVT